jgi:asparagine synthase (glutamine-hydrolysing)
MCGIFLYCGDICDVNTLHELFMQTKHRGPDDTQFVVYRTDDSTTMIAMGFHRLAINGASAAARQPFLEKGCVAMCNGEIWNHQELEQQAGTHLQSGSDCEVIPHVYRHIQQRAPRYHNQHPFEEMLCDIDGVFGITLYDRLTKHIHIGRDRIGIRSLYYATTPRKCTTCTTVSAHAPATATATAAVEVSPSARTHNLWVASELKSIPSSCEHIRPFPPGCWFSWPVCSEHTCPGEADETVKPQPYWSIGSMRSASLHAHSNIPEGYELAAKALERTLFAAVEKRFMSDRPVGCVLSGGLDSTIVTAIACKLHRAQRSSASQNHHSGRIRTYTIGLEGAEDLKWARKAAQALGTDHREFVVSEAEFLEAIPEVIRQIESFDVTTVRASVGNWLLAKHIKAVGEDTVLLCGDVADELFGGYRGFGLCTDSEAFDDANVRMLTDIHRFDVLRCEKSFAGHGLEARVPFADLAFVELAMSLPPEFKMWGESAGLVEQTTRIEKDLLRRAFQEHLPADLVWRRKEAFSDGVSPADRSWFSIIQESVQRSATTTTSADGDAPVAPVAPVAGAQPYDAESREYRKLFGLHYSCPHVIPYYWKHPFTDEQDPSARCLSNYDTNATPP